MTSRAVRISAAYVAVWLGLSVLAFLVVLSSSTRQATFLSHEATIAPSLSLRHPGQVTVHTGPVLPDVRIPSGAPIAVEVTLGKTTTSSMEELVDRYAYLASAADGEREKLAGVLRSMILDAALRAAVLGALPLLVWRLLGPHRRRQLIWERIPTVRGVAAVLVGLALALAAWQPWVGTAEPAAARWIPLPEYLDGVAVPKEFDNISIRGDVSGNEARRLIESMISSYSTSKKFYDDAAERADGLILHQPADGDTVVLVVTDRHDNIGMDAVARAIGEKGGATSVFDLGDDTSTGSSWEEFSLDSVTAAFKDWPRWQIPGNHDHGSFVGRTMKDDGWKVLDGSVVEGPGGSTLLGVADPRSSGLGDWRDQKGLTVSEIGEKLADAACDSDADGHRVTTLLVHDANAGRASLERGCVDLVLAGHVHLFVGPDAVTGSNGKTGWSFTTGTTGGAAYAFALGSKPRREAGVSLVTYHDGVPIGVQAVRLETNGAYVTDPWVPLTLTTPSS
ncbi:metallophosphoesterase [Nocardioides sp. Kera G14]|uniref:metallophosphoesterase n=1 Tax=Nocardioides sp. Kera G14 TaxID=2884264 RepID=UPI001D12F685|nr:metallophosphoesterase [Nocardioides sp. Kera G14]UDY24191.1 metallophosphoesterase [Nocardioides sp. Kera G14]